MSQPAFRVPGAARRVVKCAAAALLSLLVITCTDNPVGPGRPGLGSLRVAPTFDAFARNAPLTLDNVRVIVVRPPSDTVARVSRSFSVSSSQLTLNIPLQLQAASEDLEVTLELYAGTTLLFSGTRIVRVAQGLTPAPDSVPVAYQGPGATIAAITIGPRDTTVVFGGSFLFGATAVDSQQAPVASFYVGWTASAGTIDAAGQFTAPAARDTVTVTATTPSGITDQTTVIVAAAPATLVKVSGDNQSGIIGSVLPQPLVVRVDGTDGLPVAGVPVSFAATTGGGSVDSATVVSNGAGLATMGATLGATVGAQSFTATAPGLAAVVFSATGTSLSPVATWSGAVDTAWTTAGNWSTGAVPTNTTDVVIPAATPRAPFITTPTANARDLTVAAGATLTVGTAGLVLQGSLDAPGTLTGNIAGVSLNGTGTVRGNVPGTFFGLTVNGTYTLSGRLVAAGITVNGTLTLNGFTALVGSSAGDDFQTSNAGRLVMTNALDSLIIGGVNSSIVFDGASTAGSLTAGVILMNGSAFTGFTQDNTFSAASYAPSGTHKVVLATGATLSLSFSTPGTGSHFNILDISAQAPGFSLATPIVVNGLFVSTPSATAPAINGGNRLLTAAGGTQVTGLLLTNTPFAITGGAVTFSGVTFQGMNTAATQLTVSGPGAATPLTLNNLVFSTVPTTGFYLSATDTDGPTPNALAVDLVNPTPATPGTFTQVSGGATINWAPAAAKTWTGAISTDWSVAGNWNPAGVPTPSDDVTLPVGATRQPTLGTTGNMRDLTVQTGATLTLNGSFTINVFGDLDISGVVTLASGAPTFDLRGTGGTVRGNIPVSAGVSGSYTLNGATDVAGALSVGGGGSSLTLAGFFLSAASVNVGSGGLLIMTLGSDFLDVAGNVTMGGGDHTGRLTNGVIQAGGNFTQTSAGSPLSFAASGSHQVSLVGPTSTINFQSPGTTASRFQNLTITGGVSASLASRTVAAGNVSLSGALTLGGRTLEVGGNLSLSNPGTLAMTNALDSVLVAGNATMNGGASTGLLTAGVLRVGASFAQTGGTSAAFDASGTHRTILTGTSPSVTILNGGNTAGTSHFQELTWAGGGTLALNTGPYVLGQLTVSSAGTIAGQTFVQSLHVGQLANAAALTLFNTQLWIETTAAVPVALSNLTITVGSGVNQLYIRHPGLPAGGKLTLDQITFTSTPTNPFVYLDVDDTNTGDGNTVIVDVSNSSPAASSLVQLANGAVVNWPAAAPAKTWLGLTQDWHTTTNWSPTGLPTGTDDVVIPVTANQPIMSAAGTTRNLTVQSGVLLNLNSFTLTVNGDVSAPGATSIIGSGGTLVLAGTARSIGGTLSAGLPVNVTGSYMLSSRTVIGNLTVSGTGDLAPIGNTLVVGAALNTVGSGTLTMTDPLDSVLVTGAAIFGGGFTGGKLTDGYLKVGGSFNQTSGTTAGSFAASGNHKTELGAAAVRVVTFASPGFGTGTSQFNHLDITGATGGLTLNSNVAVLGTFTAAPAAGTPLLSGAGGQVLTVQGGTVVTGLIVDGVPIVADLVGGGSFQFDGVTFQNMPAAAIQLAVTHPGLPGGFTLSNLVFSTVPSGGLYLQATDADGSTPTPLNLNLAAPTPASDGGFSQALGGAVINWPAAAPTFGWTGAVSTDWFTAGNWSSGVVPGPTSDVTIGTGSPNAPVLNASTTVNSLTFTGSVVLNLGGGAVLTLNGSLDATAGQIQGSGPGATEAVQLTGDGATIQGSIQFANLAINGRTSVAGIMQVFGSAVLTDTLDLTNQLFLATDFTATGPAALILSQQAGAQLSVLGNATFDGGNQLGSMTDGAVSVAGNFTQLATHSGDSYHPSGAHITVINSAGNSIISFATPGTVPGTSHFQELAIAGTALDTVTFASDAYAHGNLQQTNADTTFFKSGDRTLSLGGAFFASAVVFDNTRLVVNATAPGSILFLGSVGFRNMNPLATQLSISEPGSIVPLTLTNATFTTLPTAGGFYLSATDTDGPAVPFTIDLVNPSPATPGPFAQALGGAVINWPAAGPVITWTGAVSSDWFTAGNWSNSQVPGATDSIVIVATPNDPVLTGLAIVQAVEIQGGTLVLNGQAFGTTGSFRTTGSGTITMTNAADSLDIGGDADFSGGIATGLITAGVIQVGGNFTQGGTPAAPGFEGSGTNVVRLVGGATSVTTVGSNLATVFHTLEVATSGPAGLIGLTPGLNLDGTGALRVLTPVAVSYLNPGTGALSFSAGTTTTSGSSVGGPFVSLFPGSSIQGTWTVDTTGWSQGAAAQLQVPNTIAYNHLVLQQGNNFFFDPGNFTIPGSLITRVVNAGTIRVRDTLGVRTRLTVGGTTQVFGRLTLDGGKLTTASLDVATLGGSRGFLVMQLAADSVVVSGNAAIGGGSTVGLLTAGVLQIQGNFSQTSATSVASFAPSGSHKTLLGASSARTATFASPGAGATGSHFQVLDMTAASGGLTLGSNAIVDSAFVVGVAAGAPKLVGGGNSLTARQWLVQGMDVDNAPMILNEQGTIFPHTFNNVSFAGFPTTGAQVMSITGVGSDVGLRPAFNPSNVDFVSLPTGAGNLYLKLTSTNGQAFILAMPGSNQSPQVGGNGPALSDPPNSTTVNGAQINWP